jgi:hypothetical protein
VTVFRDVSVAWPSASLCSIPDLFFMVTAIPRSVSQLTLHKLHRLAEQRLAYFTELKLSGRWKHYFSPVELEAKLNESAGFVEYWRRAVELSHQSEPLLPPSPSPVLVAPSLPPAPVMPPIPSAAMPPSRPFPPSGFARAS